MTNKILIDRGLLERVQDVLSCWSEIINYQYCGSMEAMTYLQVTDDMSQPVLNEVNAALDAPQQEAVAWQQSAAEVIASFVHLSANPTPDEWALVAVDAIRLLNIPPAHPAPSVPEEQNVPDTELPGMWEYADFSGGSTDSAAPKAPTTDDRKDAERS